MATRTISNAGGNYSNIASWVEGAVPTSADAVVATATSGNLTVDVSSACASLVLTNYVGTLTLNAQLSVSGSITFVSGMTLAGTTGPLVVAAAATLTSGGKTLTCPLTLTTAVVYTLADNWVVNGLVTVGNAGVTQVNGVGKTLTCAGGLTVSNTNVGSVKYVLAGGTWSGASILQPDVDLAGNVTLSGAMQWGTTGKTLTYVSGTVTTTGSTLTISGNSGITLNVHGITWNNLTVVGSQSYALASDLEWSGTLLISQAATTFTGAGKFNGTGAVSIPSAGTYTFNNTAGLTTTGTLTLPNAAVTFAGSAGFTVGTLTNTTYTASRTLTLGAALTYRVTAALANVGTSASIVQSFVSGTPGTRAILTLSPGATCDLVYANATDQDSSAGRQVITTRGVLSNTLNWAVGSLAAPSSGAVNVAY